MAGTTGHNKKAAPEKRIISNAEITASQQDFESVEFINCSFETLGDLDLTDCIFKNCNLSNLKTNNSRFQNVRFTDCKLLGLNFSAAKDFAFEVHFENCNMDYASFDRKKLNQSSFTNCRLHQANFTQADLSKTRISGCDFYEALFDATNLSHADLTSSRNFLIDPERNTLHKAKFSVSQLPSLLYRHDLIID